MPDTKQRIGLTLFVVALGISLVSIALAQEPPKIPSGPAEKIPETKPEARPEGKPAEAPKKKPLDNPTMLVFDLTTESGVEKGMANTLTEIVIERITNLKKYNVVGQKDLDKMLFWEQNKQLKGCTDTACLVQIAGAMGAQYYVEGSIGILGDQYVVTLKLIDAGSVKILERVTQKVKKDDNTLAKTIDPAVDVIMGLKTKESLAAMHEEKPDPVPSGAGALHAAPSAPVATAVVPPPSGFDKKLWGMVGTFTGIGVMALGGGFSALAKKAADDYTRGETVASMADNRDKNDLYKKLALTGYIVGGALTATGGVLWYLGATGEGKSAVRLVPSGDGRTLGASVLGSW